MEDENELCARLLANDHAMNVATARLLPVLLAMIAEDEEQDAERFDGLS